jgi:signal peptidase I
LNNWQYNLPGITSGGNALDFSQSEEGFQTSEPESKIPSIKQFLIDLFETVGLAVVLFFAINAVSARVRVDGFSMLPTLQNGEYVLVNRMAYNNAIPKRGDIIVFLSPVTDQDLIKRVIGQPGDQVSIATGQVLVNGYVLDEPYIAAAPIYNGEWDVPDSSLFVLGDNRNDSSDSHAWGLLPIDNVIGKAILIYWPPADWNLIEHIPNGAFRTRSLPAPV